MSANQTPAETYAARHAEIARLIDVLQLELESHRERQQAQPRSWGFPGDLGKVRAELIEAVGFLSGKTPAEIEAFLAE